MEQILVCIASYGMGNREHLCSVLKEYEIINQTYPVDVHLLLTDEFESTFNVNIHTHYYSKNIRYKLTSEHRKIMVKNLNKFDIFIYSEDDVRITYDNLLAVIEQQQELGLQFAPGLLRYEEKDDDYKYLIDCHPVHAGHRKKDCVIFKIIDDNYFETSNIHQGCYIISNEQLIATINSGNYFGDEYCGILESAASQVYLNCGLRRVLSKKHLDRILVPHLPNKYVHELPDEYTKELCPDPEKLIKMAYS